MNINTGEFQQERLEMIARNAFLSDMHLYRDFLIFPISIYIGIINDEHRNSMPCFQCHLA